MTDRSGSFRGNKAALPSKPCAVCGRAMTWRKRWAKTWAEVKVCSDACRRRRSVPGGGGRDDGREGGHGEGRGG